MSGPKTSLIVSAHKTNGNPFRMTPISLYEVITYSFFVDVGFINEKLSLKGLDFSGNDLRWSNSCL